MEGGRYSSGTFVGLALGSGSLSVAVRGPGSSKPATQAVSVDDPSPKAVAQKAMDLARSLIAQHHLDPVIAAVAGGIPGHINFTTGRVIYGYDLVAFRKPWLDVPFPELLSDTFESPAVVDNDVNCMAMYQHAFGHARRVRSFVTIYIVPELNGLGAGIMIDSRIHRGAAGGAGELGHIVVQPGGPRCHCGNRGCLQAVLGNETLVRDVNWGERQRVNNVRDAAELAERRDERASQAFSQAGRYFGQALSTIVNLLNPPLIIIGGPEEYLGPRARLSSAEGTGRGRPPRSARLFQDGYRDTLATDSFLDLDQTCRIVTTYLGLDMAAVGASLLAADAGS